MKWNILNQQKNLSRIDEIVNVLLENRGLTDEDSKREFFNPKNPSEILLDELGIEEKEVAKAIKRIKKAKEGKEKILIYGDYDADGVTATAVLWESMYNSGFDVHPYIPDRFTDGYGLNAEAVDQFITEHEDINLVITVDNGIVAHDHIDRIISRGIDVIVTDHHQTSNSIPKANAIIHSEKIAGSAVSWILVRELYNNKLVSQLPSLDLVAIGTVSDVMPLIGANRSFVKHGLQELNNLKRTGIVQLCLQAGINADQLGVYEIAFVLAPRINSMGRLSSAFDSLRLLCTKDQGYAMKLAAKLTETNTDRQKIVDEVLTHALDQAKSIDKGMLIVAHESYHEGVIGLAASKLVEKYYRPAIVISKGETISKASARSIPGFNIIENIRHTQDLLLQHGGHPMAAGFSISTTNIEEFIKVINDNCKDTLTDELLQKSIDVDLHLSLNTIDDNLVDNLKKFEPSGNGNKQPVFTTEKVTVKDVKSVGQEGKHLRLIVQQGDSRFSTIGFNLGHLSTDIYPGSIIDIAFGIEENTWNGKTDIQLKIKDIHFDNPSN